MIGITSYGVYLPRYRMERKIILKEMGWFNGGSPKGEKATVNADEDAITMAVEATINTKKSGKAEGIYMASTSFPYMVRQNSVVVSKAVGMSDGSRTADFTSSTQAGTNALLNAIETVKAGNANEIIACASDARRAKPGSPQEYTWGDGAAALSVGTENVIAEYLDSYSVSKDFIDSRRTDKKEFESVWEARWVKEEGYNKIIPSAVKGLLEKTSTSVEDYAKVCIAVPNASAGRGIAKRLGLSPEQACDNFITEIGDTGTAMPLMMLASALENAKAGDKIILVSYGYGAQALSFEVKEEVANIQGFACGVAYMLGRKKPLTSYSRYLAYKGLINLEYGIRGELVAATVPSSLNREGRTVTTLEGVKCKVCGTAQYPKHKVCVNPECGAIGQMEPYTFIDKPGKIVSFTADNLSFSMDPPQLYGLVDFEGGGRMFIDFTDCSVENVEIGDPVELTFRRKYTDELRGHYGYFWKAVPFEN
ncbi:3-hydroxy-3-methylglutaryl CoA synthase [Dethiosulfatibacter aminovorans DSM 17477]|uniref:3-hydroxy-3-methylglutaryl CoA synthase n=1 Tax=Dethiosulfatibacter aminovorans DSM 17477 TaxID=1121476 RepID=A0A1M6EY50_9FIRM|nr:OB-fold domain-containing protein [Dethiosulfatibacter aminovorans]SHI90378.1 3-hydroxy-3-methylglutaryl CoA synthase [Dethiosulfatibacter aminovorans DSM 17477]